MKNIIKILDSWGIKVSNNVDYCEYLQNYYPKNFFYIDKLPFPVSKKNYQKFDQFDTFFQELEKIRFKKNRLTRRYFDVEKKYIAIITKLWLYNDVFIESNIAEIETNKLKLVDKQYFNIIPRLIYRFQKEDFYEIKKLKELELFVQLGARGLAYTSFYFSDYQLIIIPSWSCFFIYFNDLQKINIIQEIISTEGLYLRKCVPCVEN